jgi:antitoxin (DNA-binding transcriptional repressor) of toxin-antitoxin stability system
MAIIELGKTETELSALVDRAAAGEGILIVRDGRKVAQLVALDPDQPAPRIPGLLKGRIRIGDDFDDPLPEEIMAAFRGERP